MFQNFTPKKVDLYRYTGEGYYDENNNYIPSSKQVIEIDVYGISPYRDGKNSFRIPEGYRTTAIIEVRTTTKCFTGDETDNQIPDEITINGKDYICIDAGGWEDHAMMGFQLLPDHYTALFHRKDEV